MTICLIGYTFCTYISLFAHKNVESLFLRDDVFLKVIVITSLILLNQLLARRHSGKCGAILHSHSRIQTDIGSTIFNSEFPVSPGH